MSYNGRPVIIARFVRQVAFNRGQEKKENKEKPNY